MILKFDPRSVKVTLSLTRDPSILDRFCKNHKRGQVLFDFDGNIPDIQCLPVKTDEIVEVSLRDDGGLTLARKQEKEGFIPTSYFKLLQ